MPSTNEPREGTRPGRDLLRDAPGARPPILDGITESGAKMSDSRPSHNRGHLPFWRDFGGWGRRCKHLPTHHGVFGMIGMLDKVHRQFRSVWLPIPTRRTSPAG